MAIMALNPERAHDEIFFASAENASAERGLDEITFDDLVRHIGVARTMLYRRYARRDAVIAAISELCFFSQILRARGASQ